MEQITIFDYLEQLEKLPSLQEFISIIEKKYGLKFNYTERFNRPEYVHVFNKGKKSELSIREGEFTCSDTKGQRFFAVNYSTTNSGFGNPCTKSSSVYASIEEAIRKNRELISQQKGRKNDKNGKS